VWNTQSQSSFRYQYGGSASDTTTKYDNRNVALFRNTTNGGAIATTYSWWDSNNRLLDSDIVFWDGYARFFTGSSGCGTYSNAAYLEDIATHELGHALGLNHSSSTGATMVSGYSYCSQEKRTLASDDINGAKALYPPPAATNTAPVVTITSPANGATFVQGSSISFAATATDAEDGNLSSNVQWTDNGTAFGSGNLLSKPLSLVGVHTIVAKVTDSKGVQSSSQVSITITAPALSVAGPTLTAAPRIASDGYKSVGLSWSGLVGVGVSVYRNSVKLYNTANDGTKADNIGIKPPATYRYFVCAGTTCTNTVQLTF
jgi:hypothetical protein